MRSQRTNQHAATAEVWAEVKGVWADDRTSADGRYLILGAEGNEFVVADGSGVFRTGEQILVDRLVAEPGEGLSRRTQAIALNDEDLSARLRQLMAATAGSRVYLSGTIEVDFPEDVSVMSDGQQMQTLSKSGSAVSLAYCPLELAVAQMSDQWATGTLTVLIFD